MSLFSSQGFSDEASRPNRQSEVRSPLRPAGGRAVVQSGSSSAVTTLVLRTVSLLTPSVSSQPGPVRVERGDALEFSQLGGIVSGVSGDGPNQDEEADADRDDGRGCIVEVSAVL